MRVQSNRRSRLFCAIKATCEPLEDRLFLAGNTIYVDADSPGPVRDGSSWTQAYADLQLALSAAVSGDTIRVADGTYKPTQTTAEYISFQLRSGVGIYGGYAGYGAPDPDARNTAAYPSILSGDIGSIGSPYFNSYHVVTGSGVDSTAVLDGFTIQAGSASPTSSPFNAGGGMYNSAGSPTVRNCRFIANTANSYGGAMYNGASSSPTLVNCVFIGNSVTATSAGGGAMYNSSSHPVLTNCTFIANSAAQNGAGGAMYNSSSTTVLTNCILWGNTAATSAQIYETSGATSVSWSDIQDGFAGQGNLSADPLFFRSPTPGLDRRWGSTDDDYGDLRLRLASPCIDAGDNTAIGAGVATDVTGDPRRVDIATVADTGTGSAPIVDMGAYETPRGPQVFAGGAASVPEGFIVPLTAAGCSDAGLALSYAWDFDGNGIYDDALVANADFHTAGIHGPQTRTLSVRVTDTDGLTAFDSVSVSIVPTIFVDDTATGANDGTSWTDAYQSLQAALAAAAPGQSILVAQGTYKPTTTADRSASFALKLSVAMYGGWAGVGAEDPFSRDIRLYSSILSGDIGTPGVTSDNSYHVVVGAGTYTSTLLDGFTITAGCADGTASSSLYGGGMYNTNGSLIVRNCTFIANSASFSGGGMYNDLYAAPTLLNCTFIGNTASTGGGLYTNKSIAVTNCTFIGNHASGGGGGLYTYVNSQALTNCIFRDNSAPSSPQIRGSGGTTAVTYSDVQGGWSGVGNVDVDPAFVRNPSPGADGAWGTMDDDYGDLRPQPYSPVADAGNNAAAGLSGITTDAAGGSRFLDIPTTADTGIGSPPIVDMGAYEAVPALTADLGGPYLALETEGVTLVGRGSSAVPGELLFEWEWSGDNQFDDAAGPIVPIPMQSWPLGMPVTVSLRVTDAASQRIVTTTTVTILPLIVYVDDSAAGNNAGTSWDNAMTSLASALDIALPGQEIRVAAGTYKPTSDTDRTISFVLRNNVTLRGGYAGASAPDARDPAAYSSVLSGDIGIPGDNSDNCYHVLIASDTDATAVLDGFTITGGNADGASFSGYGGGMYCESGSPTLVNCTFTGNTAVDGGGGMYAFSSSPTLTDCAFTGNSAGSSGGGLYASNGSPSVFNCTFTANAAQTGGGVFNSATATFTGCAFVSNFASYSGGGMYVSSRSPSLINCLISGNSASSGGGLYNAATMTLTNCTISGNTATAYVSGYGGGGILTSSALTASNCIIWGNNATYGSQIYWTAGTSNITYSDVQGGWTGTGNKKVDPRFVHNPGPGADGAWGTVDDDLGDLHLQLISEAIDAGSNTAIGTVATDFGGDPRRQDIAIVADSGSGTAPIVDMGAYEATPAPQALAGGPYVVLEGFTVALAGTGYSDKGVALSYAWDFDADGIYDDATGPSPVFSTAGLSGPQTRFISLRVTDSEGIAAYSTATVSIDRPLYVDDSATGANDGTSWGDAFQSLQTALAAATAGKTILVAQGTYRPTETSDVLASFSLRTDVAVYGGYAGVGAAEPYARDVHAYASILSGDIGVVGATSDNSHTVVTGDNTTSSSILDGFTITGSNGYSGRGMSNANANPTVRNCRFIANTGYAVWNSRSSPTMIDCDFSSNLGVGVYNSGSSPWLINCSFTGNTDSGIQNTSSSAPTLINCTFVGNTRGVSNESGEATLINCTLTGNAGYGVSSPSDFRPMSLINCIVWDNASGSISGYANVTYSDIQGGWSGPGNINVDPLLSRNYVWSAGIDGLITTGDEDYGDLRLRPTSPCVDAGSNAAIPSGTTTDIAGNPRRQDIATRTDTGAGTPPIVDMGAYEAGPGLMAVCGGVYVISEQTSVNIAGAGYSDQGLALSYAWDFDADGAYDDAVGPTATFSALGIVGPQVRTVSLRVSDATGNTAIDTATVYIAHPIYVDDSAAGAADGSSWDDAFPDLQSALASARAGQMILVGQGTYRPTTTDDRNVSFRLKKGVALYGGYAGVTGADAYVRDVDRYPSVLSGDIAAPGDNADNSYHVVVGDNTDMSAVLDGFTITAGNAHGDTDATQHGGGIYNVSGHPTLRNCVITLNSAVFGGGMAGKSSSPALTNCLFAGNTADLYSGGMDSYSGLFGDTSNPSPLRPTLTNCAFVGNTARYGGGMTNSSSFQARLINCTFVANVAFGNGGGLSNHSPAPTLTNCIIWGNTANNSIVSQIEGSATLTYCDIQGFFSGTGNRNADPLFVRNPSPGADGAWGTADDDYGDLRLASLTSPAVDAGNNAAVPAGITTDLAGNPRFVDIPQKTNAGAGGSLFVDMGAYERLPVATTISGTAGDDALCLRFSEDRTTLDVFAGLVATGEPTASYALEPGDSSIIVDTGAGDDTVVLSGFAAGDHTGIQSTFIAFGSVVLASTNLEKVLLDAPANSVLDLASLDVAAPAALSASTNLTLRASSLNITGSGSLDLAGHEMILDYSGSPVAQVRQWLGNGRIGTTPSLVTSGTAPGGIATPGMVDNELLHLSAFSGQPLADTFSQLLIHNTVAGDTNLDGVVNQSDYLPVIANMGMTDSQWFLGDLNSDGLVDAGDFAEVTAHLGAAASPSALPSAAKASPAPATVAAASAVEPAARAAAVQRSAPRRPTARQGDLPQSPRPVGLPSQPESASRPIASSSQSSSIKSLMSPPSILQLLFHDWGKRDILESLE